MKLISRPLTTYAAVAALVSTLALVGSPQVAGAANQIAGIGSSRTVTAKVKVKSVNLATRRAILIGPDGTTFAVEVGAHVRNLDRVKPGDTIKATYNLTTEYVLSGRAGAAPADTDVVLAGRAAKGQLPAGAVAERTVTTDVVLGVDPAKNTLRLSNPNGGRIETVHVTNPLAQKQLHKVKVGDRVTARVTQSLLIAVDRL
jgi:exosome complex RNA-binding protein Csl4